MEQVDRPTWSPADRAQMRYWLGEIERHAAAAEASLRQASSACPLLAEYGGELLPEYARLRKRITTLHADLGRFTRRVRKVRQAGIPEAPPQAPAAVDAAPDGNRPAWLRW